MEECLRCGDTDGELFIVSPDDDAETIAGRICTDCEKELVWTGVEVGPGGTCGYSDNCNRMAVYATIRTDVGEAKKRNNLVCGYHLSKIDS